MQWASPSIASMRKLQTICKLYANYMLEAASVKCYIIRNEMHRISFPLGLSVLCIKVMTIQVHFSTRSL